MSKYKNLLIILLVLIVPVGIYYMTKANVFEGSLSMAEVFESKKPVVLDFTSEMCLECKELGKVLKPTMKEYNGKIIFKQIQISSTKSEDEKLITKYNVNVVPTLVFIDKNGKTVRTTEGSMPKAELQKYLDELING